MTYIEIWRERIAAGEATQQQATVWLLAHGMNPIKIWMALNG
jgi:hypothetical protein|tara:strand:+ start:1984 stop:2109 length:126 start_codon:yes stop_codon:yes gene_type:complete